MYTCNLCNLTNQCHPNKLNSKNKEGNPATYDNMEEPGGHKAKRNKPDTERKALHGLTYVSNLKILNSSKQRLERWLTRARRWENGEMLVKRYKVVVMEDE